MRILDLTLAGLAVLSAALAAPAQAQTEAYSRTIELGDGVFMLMGGRQSGAS